MTCAGSDVLAQALPGSANPDKFDTDFFGCPVPLLFSWSGRTIEEAPAELRSVLRLPDLGGIDPREDRLQEVAIQIFQARPRPWSTSSGGVPGSVKVQGWNGRISRMIRAEGRFSAGGAGRCKGSRGPFWRGLLWRSGTEGEGHSFFRSTPNYGLLWVLALVLGLCIVPLVLWWVLPAERRSRKGALVAGLPALLVALTQAGLAATGGPSLDHARAVASRGQMEEALRESAACFDLGIEAESAGSFHDRLQLGRVRQTREPQKAWEAAGSAISYGGWAGAGQSARGRGDLPNERGSPGEG